MAKVEKKPETLLQKTIRMRERGIERMTESKSRVMRIATAECAAIDKRIAERRVLLDALKRGEIKG